MNPGVAELVRSIHTSPVRACLAVTGVGTLAVAWLFSEPGASRTILDVQVPYSSAALHEYVGAKAGQHVSADEAHLMADAALRRARRLEAPGTSATAGRLIGLGCTGAVATDRARRGEDRVHVAWSDGARRKAYSVVFDKSARDRKGEEAVSSALILNALAEACGVPLRLRLALLPGEVVVDS